jgi:hypothetical protein
MIDAQKQIIQELTTEKALLENASKASSASSNQLEELKQKIMTTKNMQLLPRRS